AYQRRIDLMQGIIGQAKLADRRRTQIGDQCMGAAGERVQLGLSPGRAEIYYHATLVAVEAGEIFIVRPDEVRTDLARDIATGRFDLDHVGAEIRQQQAAIGTCQHMADFKDPYAAQRTAHLSVLAIEATTSASGISLV